MTPPTFGSVKDEIALVVSNGVAGTDSRVMPLTNAAMRALQNAMPRGVYVGGLMQATINVSAGPPPTITLPDGMDVAFVVEAITDPMTFSGWFNIVNPSTFVDPDDIMDTVLVDLGYTGASNARKYAIPELPGGTTQVSVWGLKTFVPVTGDDTLLIVPNVEAIKEMILAMDGSQRYADREGAKDHRAQAVQILKDELQRALLDPQRYSARRAQWQKEAATYAKGTLGNTRALIALDIDDGQKIGRFRINRLVDRALSWIYQRIYEYELIERNRVKASVPTLTAVPTDPTAALSPAIPHEIIRQIAQAILAEDREKLSDNRVTPGAEMALAQKLAAEASAMLIRVLDAQLEALRHSTYTTGVNAYITAGTTTQLGYFVAKLGLDMPGGLRRSDQELSRLVNEAAREALQHRNSLARTERYSNVAGPDAIAFTYALTVTDAVSYPDYETLRLLVEAQLSENPETVRALRADAQRVIERNLQKAIEAARNSKWQCLLVSNPFPQFGGARAQIGLEFSGDGGEDGYKVSDGFVSRITQQAWSELVDQQNYLTRSEDYEKPALTRPAFRPADDAVIPFPLELVKLMAESQICQDKNQEERGTAYKKQAADLLQRNIIADVERSRYQTCKAQSALDSTLFGYYVGRLGLEIEGGLAMSDAARRRLVNKAEELLADSGQWKNFDAEFLLDVDPDGLVTLPADVERIIYAERCNSRLELRGRKWFYVGYPSQCPNACGLMLNYAGPDADDNATYYVGDGVFSGNDAGSIPQLRALCRRKWAMKTSDSEPMLVRHYPALELMALSILDKAAKDYQGASIKANSALKAMDNQLGVETDGQVSLITVKFPGESGHYMRRRFR